MDILDSTFDYTCAIPRQTNATVDKLKHLERREQFELFKQLPEGPHKKTVQSRLKILNQARKNGFFNF